MDIIVGCVCEWLCYLNLSYPFQHKDSIIFRKQGAWCVTLNFIDRSYTLHPKGLPGGTNGKEPAGQCRRHGSNPWVRKIPWRRKWQPTLVFLLEKSHAQRSLVGYSPWGHKKSDTTEHVCMYTHTHTHTPLALTVLLFKWFQLANRAEVWVINVRINKIEIWSLQSFYMGLLKSTSETLQIALITFSHF